MKTRILNQKHPIVMKKAGQIRKTEWWTKTNANSVPDEPYFGQEGRGRGITRGRARSRTCGRGRDRGRGASTRNNRENRVWIAKEKHTPDLPNFTAQPGLQVPLPDNPSAIDFLQLFIDDGLLDLLVGQTNIYANQNIEANQNNRKPRARAKNWENTNREEMIKFLALTLLMGIFQKPEYQLYWDQDPLLQTPFFSTVMPRARYLILLQFLHFAENSKYDPEDENRDRL